MSEVLIKVCGLTNQTSIDLVVKAGAALCGFIFHPASPRHCQAEQVAALHTQGLGRVGVFVQQSVEEMASILRDARLDLAQVHTALPLQEDLAHAQGCATMLGADKLIKVCWPQRHPSRAHLQEHMEALAAHCAFFLLDAGMDGGGSGQRLNLASLRGLKAPRPWLLAGGLTPGNARQALQHCPAAGLDFNSGLESQPGIKCPHKLRQLADIVSQLHQTKAAYTASTRHIQ